MRLERLEALLWERIDGTIGAEDQVELEAFLAGDLEARELDQELTALAKRLAGVREVAPPTALRERIDQALAAAQQPASAAAPSALTPRRTADGWGPRLFALAAALFLGVAIGHLLHLGAGRPVDVMKAAGTMHEPTSGEAPPTVEIDLGSGVGLAMTRRDGSTISVELVLAGEGRVEAVMEAANDNLRIVGLHQGGNAPIEVTAAGGRVVMGVIGPGSFGMEILSGTEEAPVRLSVSAGGEVLAERWIDPSSKAVQP